MRGWLLPSGPSRSTLNERSASGASRLASPSAPAELDRSSHPGFRSLGRRSHASQHGVERDAQLPRRVASTGKLPIQETMRPVGPLDPREEDALDRVVGRSLRRGRADGRDEQVQLAQLAVGRHEEQLIDADRGERTDGRGMAAASLGMPAAIPAPQSP